MSRIHISTVKRMLQAPEPVDLTIITSRGEVQHWNDVLPLRFDFYRGTRRVKFRQSGEIRQLRDVLIIELNGQEVFL